MSQVNTRANSSEDVSDTNSSASNDQVAIASNTIELNSKLQNQIRFDPEQHQYFVDDEKVESVTTFLKNMFANTKPAPLEYYDASYLSESEKIAKLYFKKEVGNLVHKRAENIIKGNDDGSHNEYQLEDCEKWLIVGMIDYDNLCRTYGPEALTEHVKKRVEQFKLAWEELQEKYPKGHGAELIMFADVFGKREKPLAGRADILMIDNNDEIVVIDIKNVESMDFRQKCTTPGSPFRNEIFTIKDKYFHQIHLFIHLLQHKHKNGLSFTKKKVRSSGYILQLLEDKYELIETTPIEDCPCKDGAIIFNKLLRYVIFRFF
jgi:hypothetical protein